jgi:hypothetical protein
MATNSMIPYSNPAGNNQTTPSSGVPAPIVNGSVPSGGVGTTLNPTAPGASSSNPLVPGSPVNSLPTVVSGTPGTVPNAGSTSANASNTQAQLSDIYGSGVGTDISNLLGSIGGVDSATLQEYIASLAPQEATAQANLTASLGAGGVSANSSVAAIGEANLNAQETAAVAGESANLTQSGEQLEASILGTTEQAAEQQVSESGWTVFGDVLGAVGGDAAKVVGGALSGGYL